jgi:hypothetical protein
MEEFTEICTDQNVASGASLQCTVLCDTGLTVISGGFECNLTGAGGAAPTNPACDLEFVVQRSRPENVGAGWNVLWRNHSAGSMSAQVTSYAYCAEVEGCSPSDPLCSGPPDPP